MDAKLHETLIKMVITVLALLYLLAGCNSTRNIRYMGKIAVEVPFGKVLSLSPTKVGLLK